MEDHRTRRATAIDLVLVVRPFLTGFLEPERLCEEPLLLRVLPHREDDAVEASGRDIDADFLRRPARADVRWVLQHLEEKARRMLEADELASEAFLHAAVLDAVPLEMFGPEFRGVSGDAIDRGLNLARSGSSWNTLVRECRHHGADFRVRVGVIEVIVGVPAIEQHRLLDQTLAHHLRTEIDVFLGSRCTQRDVVETLDQT